MARIAGVNIPTQKRVVIALQYIHGIGQQFSKEICEKVGIAPERRVSELTDAEVLQIRETIDRDYNVEGDLRRENRDQHQAPDGPWLLSRPALSPRAFRFAASARTPTRARAKARPNHRRQETSDQEVRTRRNGYRIHALRSVSVRTS